MTSYNTIYSCTLVENFIHLFTYFVRAVRKEINPQVDVLVYIIVLNLKYPYIIGG